MIVVFGSINLDATMRTERLPDPGETVIGSDYFMNPGGKGANQAYAAAQAGAKVKIFGCIGNDAVANWSLEYLKKANVDLEGVQAVERPTGCASIWVDESGENAIIVSPGANNMAKADMVPDSVLNPETLLLLQMEVPVAENWKLIKRARAKGCRIMLNVAPAGLVPDEILRSIDILLVNEGEGARVARDVGLTNIATTRLPRELSSRYNLTCILTLGGAGALSFGPDGGWLVPAMSLSPVDSTGAGDTFAGVIAAIHDGGATLPDAMRLATIAGGLTCLTQGSQTSMPSLEDITDRLEELPPSKNKY